MSLLQKLPGSRRAPHGLEWRIAKKMPWILLGGTAVPALCFLYALLFPNPDIGDTIEKYLSGVAIAAVAATLTIWTTVFTIAIGCGIVWVMKGPAYVADRYPLIDADAPAGPSPADHEERPAIRR